MRLEVLPDAEAASLRGAKVIAEVARAAIAARGRFVLAASGGGTPHRMFRLLADEALPWEKVHVFQVDERVAPAGDPARNLTDLASSLLAHAPIPPAQVHAMPVEAKDLAAAAASYAAELRAAAGDPPVLDLVQLGLGSDGHTASLVSGDPALLVKDAPVATTGPYEGHVRMTLTFPVLDAARHHDELAGVKRHVAVAKLHYEGTFHDQEHLVLVVVVMPDERTLEFHQLHVLAVQFAHDLRAPLLLKLAEFFREINLIHIILCTYIPS